MTFKVPSGSNHSMILYIANNAGIEQGKTM